MPKSRGRRVAKFQNTGQPAGQQSSQSDRLPSAENDNSDDVGADTAAVADSGTAGVDDSPKPPEPASEPATSTNESAADTITRLTAERDQARSLVEKADIGLPIEAKSAMCQFVAGSITAYELNLLLRTVLEQDGIENVRHIARYISEIQPRIAGPCRIHMKNIEHLARVKDRMAGKA